MSKDLDSMTVAEIKEYLISLLKSKGRTLEIFAEEDNKTMVEWYTAQICAIGAIINDIDNGLNVKAEYPATQPA